VPKSPYVVSVEAMAVDAGKVRVEGPGIDGVVTVNETTSFSVLTQGCTTKSLFVVCENLRDFVEHFLLGEVRETSSKHISQLRFSVCLSPPYSSQFNGDLPTCKM